MPPTLTNDLILQAAAAKPVSRPPVWMMRQAGRYLPEYQAVRAQAGSFLNLCKNPKLAAEVSIQPYEILGVDAIIMFSDILVIPEAMGAELTFDNGGPKFTNPIRTVGQINELKDLNKTEIASSCDFVFETLDLIQKQVDNKVPVLGFAGAPWTLASYMIEGGGSKNFENIKSMMYQNPVLMHTLLSRITSAVIEYLSLKIEHGAALVQIFDTWASALDRDDYTKFALPYQQQIISELHKRHPETKITLYVNGVSNIFDLMVASGADLLSIDWRMDLAEAFRQLKQLSGSRTISLQGNLDPCFLLGSPELIVSKTTAMLDAAKAGIDSQHGYIANLGHGIIPQVPVVNAKLFIDTVQNFKY